MIEAHASMSGDFASSCEEIDFLVDSAVTLPGCFGARITGGGFGGCTVNLVKEDAAHNFVEQLEEAYRERFQVAAQSYTCAAVDGAFRANGLAEAEA